MSVKFQMDTKNGKYNFELFFYGCGLSYDQFKKELLGYMKKYAPGHGMINEIAKANFLYANEIKKENLDLMGNCEVKENNNGRFIKKDRWASIFCEYSENNARFEMKEF